MSGAGDGVESSWTFTTAMAAVIYCNHKSSQVLEVTNYQQTDSLIPAPHFEEFGIIAGKFREK